LKALYNVFLKNPEKRRKVRAGLMTAVNSSCFWACCYLQSIQKWLEASQF